MLDSMFNAKLWNGKKGFYSRCEVPQRPVSLLPEMRTDSAMFDSVATWQSLRHTSRCCPFPVFVRPRSAAIMLFAVYKPVVRSVTAQPTLTGGPSRVPVMCINPISLQRDQYHIWDYKGREYVRFNHNIVPCSVAIWSKLSISSHARIYQLRVRFTESFKIKTVFL